jgi:hypothetical protein
VIDDVRSEDALYVVGLSKAVRSGVQNRHAAALAYEAKYPVDKVALDVLWKRETEKRRKKR